MHTNWCVLKKISMEIGMWNFGVWLFASATVRETHFSIMLSLTRLVRIPFPILSPLLTKSFDVIEKILSYEQYGKNWEEMLRRTFAKNYRKKWPIKIGPFDLGTCNHRCTSRIRGIDGSGCGICHHQRKVYPRKFPLHRFSPVRRSLPSLHHFHQSF